MTEVGLFRLGVIRCATSDSFVLYFSSPGRTIN